MRSALQGVNTQVLEKDLEKMNDKWNALKEKVGLQIFKGFKLLVMFLAIVNCFHLKHWAYKEV